MAQAEQTRSPARQRRRGEELEAALLESAWQELAEAGFAKMTMESVAARAKTGVAVLYRRWPNKSDLVLAAIRHYGATHPIEVPDTGNLRDDLIALLEGTGAVRVGFVAAVTAAFSGLLSDTGLTPAEVREKIMADRPIYSRRIFDRAHERGEIDLATIPPAVLSMPFDLMRHDMLMTYRQIPRERVLAIVDDLFMPLVGRASSA
ncbi:TetR/AcrR family transcriptional regulator [Actinospica robiniae]|uniref:TetR/AcrR family transcriptional regulator n=1 Tax=Actinospica robiniae TaxID=304901 RepID=UPI00041D970B|nr:TetR/AcrR family transcriptional regulator [Actinospica robiniae]